MSTIYLAGPMRGFPGHRHAAFDLAAAVLRERGWTVLNPAEINADVPDPITNEWLRGAMERDCAAVCRSDAILMMPAWRTSLCAQAEHALAVGLGLTVYMSIGDVPGRGE